MYVQIIYYENPRGRRLVGTVCSMWLAKSASVRVWPIVGAINSPLDTWKLPISVIVPCRVYSNSIFSHCP